MAENDKTTYCKKSVERDESGKITGRILFAFQDGKDPIIFEIDRCNDEVRDELTMHGASQKGGDAHASAGGDFEWGRERTQRVIDNLYAGDWRAARAAGAGRDTLTMQAILRVATDAGLSEDEARAKWVEMDDATQAGVAKDPAVKLAKTVIQKERAEAELKKKGSALTEAFA